MRVAPALLKLLDFVVGAGVAGCKLAPCSYPTGIAECEISNLTDVARALLRQLEAIQADAAIGFVFGILGEVELGPLVDLRLLPRDPGRDARFDSAQIGSNETVSRAGR